MRPCVSKRSLRCIWESLEGRKGKGTQLIIILENKRNILKSRQKMGSEFFKIVGMSHYEDNHQEMCVNYLCDIRKMRCRIKEAAQALDPCFPLQRAEQKVQAQVHTLCFTTALRSSGSNPESDLRVTHYCLRKVEYNHPFIRAHFQTFAFYYPKEIKGNYI